MVCQSNSWASPLWFDAVFEHKDVVGYFPDLGIVRYWINSLTDVYGNPIHYMVQVIL